MSLEVSINGQSPSVHRLPYLRTNCAGNFEVLNNSVSAASLIIHRQDGSSEKLETSTGAVLEMVG